MQRNKLWERSSRRAVFNAANEVAVEASLNGQPTFPGIWQTVERVMTAHQVIAHPTLEVLIEANDWARREAKVWRTRGWGCDC